MLGYSSQVLEQVLRCQSRQTHVHTRPTSTTQHPGRIPKFCCILVTDVLLRFAFLIVFVIVLGGKIVPLIP